MQVEICVRVVDKTNSKDDYLNSALSKKGDVIGIYPVGVNWGNDIINGADWRILKVNIPVMLINSLMADETGTFAFRSPRKRRYKLDFLRLPASRRNAIMGNIAKVHDLRSLNISALSRLKTDI